MAQVTSTITITTNDECTMLKIHRVLAWMHYNSMWGHSGVIATSIDGDGHEKVKVEGFDLETHKKYVDNVPVRQRHCEWVGCGTDDNETT